MKTNERAILSSTRNIWICPECGLRMMHKTGYCDVSDSNVVAIQFKRVPKKPRSVEFHL